MGISLAKYKISTSSHPPYFLDLVPKKCFYTCWNWNQKVNVWHYNWQTTITECEFSKCFQSLYENCNKYIQSLWVWAKQLATYCPVHRGFYTILVPILSWPMSILPSIYYRKCVLQMLTLVHMHSVGSNLNYDWSSWLSSVLPHLYQCWHKNYQNFVLKMCYSTLIWTACYIWQ